MIVRKSTEIYLDSNATTPVLPAAAQAAQAAMEDVYGNPSSTHVSGLKARHILESARDRVRQLLGAKDGQIVFTSGATEAIQMGVFSTLCHVRQVRKQSSAPASEKRYLLYGATEHKAVPQAITHWNELLGIDNEVLEIPVNERGELDLDWLARHAPQADLICTMAVNNETGVIHPLDQIETVIRSSNPDAMWLVDCVQAIGKLQLELSQTTIDYASVSGHKIYAPKGIGLLYVREGSPLIPMMAGGGQEHGARGGTENLPGVAAIDAVMGMLVNSDKTFADEAVLQDRQQRLVNALRTSFPSVVFNTPFENSVATTINFTVKGFVNKELLDLFDAAGIRVSSGSACGSKVQGSYVLEAMGLPQWRSDGAIRMSFGPLTADSEIDAACERIAEAGRALCDSCLLFSEETDMGPGERLDGLIQLKNGSMCTWLLMDAESKNCVVVDPFEELADRTESLIRCQQSNVLAILDSHAHVDHDSCRLKLAKVLGPLAATASESSDPLGWPNELADQSVTLDDGTSVPSFQFSSRYIIAQVDLPGHTKVGRAFLVGTASEDGRLPAEAVEFAFAGDMVLMGGIGRTDFPCSDVEAMYHSLRRLASIISPETILCATHDYNNEFATTLAFERQHNPFLDSLLCDDALSLDEFLVRKPEIDAGINDESNDELVCGLIQPSSGSCTSVLNVQQGELKQFFRQHRDSWIIDVREPHEYSFEQDWSEVGLESPPQNIPLTRISGFLPELKRAMQQKPRDVIFLCRSGKRSGVAAATARRAGIATAKSIAGGIALNVSTRCVSDEWAEPGYMI